MLTGMDKIIKADYIYIDTSSTMLESFSKFLSNYENTFKNNGKKIIISEQVIYELLNHFNNPQKEEKALSAIEAIKEYEGIIELKNNNLVEEKIGKIYADSEFIALFAKNKNANQVFIVNDTNLAKDTLKFREMNTLKYNIFVYKLNSNGYMERYNNIKDEKESENEYLKKENDSLIIEKNDKQNKINILEENLAYEKEKNEKLKQIEARMNSELEVFQSEKQKKEQRKEVINLIIKEAGKELLNRSPEIISVFGNILNSIGKR